MTCTAFLVRARNWRVRVRIARACLIMRGFFHNVSYRYDYFLKYSLGYRLSLKAVNQRHTASPRYNIVLFSRDSLKKKIKALTARLRSTIYYKILFQIQTN